MGIESIRRFSNGNKGVMIGCIKHDFTKQKENKLKIYKANKDTMTQHERTLLENQITDIDNDINKLEVILKNEKRRKFDQMISPNQKIINDMVERKKRTRRNQQQDIARENMRLFQRFINIKPSINTTKMMDEHNKRRNLVKNICHQPFVLKHNPSK